MRILANREQCKNSLLQLHTGQPSCPRLNPCWQNIEHMGRPAHLSAHSQTSQPSSPFTKPCSQCMKHMGRLAHRSSGPAHTQTSQPSSPFSKPCSQYMAHMGLPAHRSCSGKVSGTNSRKVLIFFLKSLHVLVHVLIRIKE